MPTVEGRLEKLETQVSQLFEALRLLGVLRPETPSNFDGLPISMFGDGGEGMKEIFDDLEHLRDEDYQRESDKVGTVQEQPEV